MVALLMRRGWQGLIWIVAAQGIAFALLIPWGLRNLAVNGKFTYVRDTSWQIAFGGLGEVDNPWELGYDDYWYFKWTGAHCPTTDDYFACQERVRNYIIHDVVFTSHFPGHLLRLVMLRLPRIPLMLIQNAAFSMRLDPAWPAIATLALAIAINAMNALSSYLIPAAAVGLLTLPRSKWGPTLIAAAPTSFLTAFSLVFGTSFHHTTPGLGFIIVPAAIGIVEVATALRGAPASLLSELARHPVRTVLLTYLGIAVILSAPILVLIQPASSYPPTYLPPVFSGTQQLILIGYFVIYILCLAIGIWLLVRRKGRQLWQLIGRFRDRRFVLIGLCMLGISLLMIQIFRRPRTVGDYATLTFAWALSVLSIGYIVVMGLIGRLHRPIEQATDQPIR